LWVRASVRALVVAELNGRPVIISGGRDGIHGSRDGTVQVLDLRTGSAVSGPLRGHDGSVDAVAVGELEGRPVVVSGGSHGTVRVWDLRTGSAVGEPWRAHKSYVRALAVGDLEDRPVVISSGSVGPVRAPFEETVRVWDLTTGRAVGEPWRVHRGGVRALAVGELEDRPVVVSGGKDGTVRVWRPDGQVQRTLDVGAAVLGVALAPGSRIVVAASMGLMVLQFAGTKSARGRST
jgi:WD40 repeat protein